MAGRLERAKRRFPPFVHFLRLWRPPSLFPLPTAEGEERGPAFLLSPPRCRPQRPRTMGIMTGVGVGRSEWSNLPPFYFNGLSGERRKEERGERRERRLSVKGEKNIPLSCFLKGGRGLTFGGVFMSFPSPLAEKIRHIFFPKIPYLQFARLPDLGFGDYFTRRGENGNECAQIRRRRRKKRFFIPFSAAAFSDFLFFLFFSSPSSTAVGIMTHERGAGGGGRIMEFAIPCKW